jgi:hypothetical protein
MIGAKRFSDAKEKPAIDDAAVCVCYGALLAMPVAAEFAGMCGTGCHGCGGVLPPTGRTRRGGPGRFGGQASCPPTTRRDRWERDSAVSNLPDVSRDATMSPRLELASAGRSCREDYYRYKYLPLGEREAEVAPPRSESDIPGRSFEAKVVRRDAYYFAFDNPYEFYARNDADDGFAAEVSSHVSSQVADTHARFHLVARGRFAAPWRAAHHLLAGDFSPVERTLKNYYFMGRLETLWFCSDDGRILAKLGQ